MKVIFFDTSDTLYHNPDFEKAQKKQPIAQLSEKKNISSEEACVLFKKTKEELKSQMVHVPKVAVMMKLGISRLDMQEALAEVDANDYLIEDAKLKLILDDLSNKYELGIITNVLKKFLGNILDALDIDIRLFKYIVSVDNTNNSKPHSEPFEKAIKLVGVSPEECVYVGDSLTKDMIPAKKIGMKTIWITKEPKKDSHVDQIINSIYEIEEALNKI